MKRFLSAFLSIVLILLLLPLTTVNAAISTTNYYVKMQEFISDSRWANGTPWGYDKKQEISSWKSQGCCSYCADFATYVYGSANAWNSSDFYQFSDPNEIRAGDIIYVQYPVSGGYGEHWFVVLERNGNTLHTAEGNCRINGVDQVYITDTKYSISNGALRNKYDSAGYTYFLGRHYNFSDTSQPNVNVSWNNQTQTAYETNFYAFVTAQTNYYGTFQEAGITVWDSNGTVVAQKSESPNHSNSVLDIWYNITDETGSVLSPGQNYAYQFRVRFNGTDFYSPTYSVTTTCSHSNVIIDAAVQPTCMASGLTEGSHCGICGAVLTAQTVAPATGHSYENNVCKYCGDVTISWSFDEATGTLTISGEGLMPDYSVTSSEDDRPWASLTAQIKNVVVCGGITGIGANAFRNCSSLGRVSLPEGVTRIGGLAFYGCSALSSITFPDSLTSFGEAAFACSALSEIVIPDSVTNIGERAFAVCKNLSKVTLPEHLTEIDNWAFYSCSSLTEITIPDSVTCIDSSFDYCTSLEKVTLSKKLTRLDGGFYKCASLKEITIPASVTFVGQSSFSFCDDLKIYFTGDAPIFSGANPSPFTSSTLTIYYPAGNDTWTSDVMKKYDATITWIPYDISYREEDPTSYDVNNDGIVNERDAEYLLWHTLFPSTYPIHISGDINGDGSENSNDAVYLLWYALGLL